MMGNMMIIECPDCGAKNSVDKSPEPGKRYRCWKCRAVISYQSDNISNKATGYPATDRESIANMMSEATSYQTMGGKGMASAKNSALDKQMRYKTNYDWSVSDAFRPNGRFSRYQYVFLSIIVPLPVSILFTLLRDKLPILILLLAFPLVILLAIIAVISAIRRLHDVGHSGWWYMLYFVPLANIALTLYLIFMPGKVEKNKWG